MRKRVVFRYEKCGLYVFSNTNVTNFLHQTARHNSQMNSDVLTLFRNGIT